MLASTEIETSSWKAMHFLTDETICLKRMFIVQNLNIVICPVSTTLNVMPTSVPACCVTIGLCLSFFLKKAFTHF